MSEHDRPTAARTHERLEGLRAAVSAIEERAGDPPTPPPDPATRDADSDPHAVARAVVLRQLTGAPKSRKQLQEALTRKGCPPEVAREVLDRFEEVGLVDDEAYAQMLVRSKQSGRGLARRALQHELRAKGVDDEIARGVLDTIEPDDEREIARGLVEKKLRTMHGLDRQVQVRRLSGLLARKGYGAEVSRQVITEALDALPEHQRD